MKHFTSRRQPGRPAIERKLARQQAGRWAQQCPPRPVEHDPGTLLYRLVLEDAAGLPLSYVTLHAPARRRGSRSRCDSFEVRDEWGVVVVDRGGLHSTARAAPAAIWPKVMSRKAQASLV